MMVDKMIQLHDNDDGLAIADRTISLRYRQFRTPRKELQELILYNKKTYILSEAEKRKYEKCLNWNVSLIENKPNFDEIHVDFEGFSIEMAKNLGNDYLMDKCALVATEQIDCDSIRDSYSGKHNGQQIALIRKMFNIHRNTIEQILIGEALIGIIDKKDINLLIDNPDSLFSIEVSFDTPNNAISKLKKIRKEEKILLENKEKLKDRVFLKNILQTIDDISDTHGSLNRHPEDDLNLREKVDFNKLRLDDNVDIYCIKSTDGTNIFVYFFADDKQLFNDDDIYMSDDLVILNGKDIGSLNILVELGIVGYNPYIGLERCFNMILRGRKEKGANISYMDLKNMSNIDKDKTPERARELLMAVESLVKNNTDKDFFTSLGRIKICMTYPLFQNEILYELLTRMEDDEYKSCYMDAEKFVQKASNMDDQQLGEFVKKILYSLEFEEENNTMVNMWLIENKKNICDDLGIKFVKI